MKTKWSALSIANKVYVLVGTMFVFITLELLVLLFAMHTFTGIRAFVMGEGRWSKAQKNAIIEIQNYARTGDIKHYVQFKEHILLPISYHRVRLEFAKPEPNLEAISEALADAKIQHSDISPMIDLIHNFKDFKKLSLAYQTWSIADDKILRLGHAGDKLHRMMLNKVAEAEKIEATLQSFEMIESDLKVLEKTLSTQLSEAVRWFEKWAMWLLLIFVSSLEVASILLIVFLSRSLKRTLSELNEFAKSVSEGDYSKQIPIRSADEIGDLSRELNNMAIELKERTSETRLAEKSNQIKNLFLANMSHEIRTPLNSILGFIDLLKDRSLSEQEQMQYIEVIERTGNSLATIINDILDISKVEAGKLQIQNSKVSLCQIINDLKTILTVRSSEKGIYLNFIQKGDIPVSVVTDGTRLKQILLNIIGNAIKFTNSGGVTVTYQVLNNNFYCWVHDTGIGISSTDRSKLFKPFSQIDLSLRRNFGGTGLGLILSKKIAELLGGDVILLESKLAEGSTFLITVHLQDSAWQIAKPQNLPSEIDSNPKKLSDVKVLLVEDSLDNQVLAEKFLAKAGIQVDIANNGKEGVQRALNDSYDVILMDMQMPVLDGYSATAELRSAGYDKPIIALTANAMKEDLDRCLSAGCNHFLTKPFKHQNLIQLVSKYSNPNRKDDQIYDAFL